MHTKTFEEVHTNHTSLNWDLAIARPHKIENSLIFNDFEKEKKIFLI